ncbi:MAG: NAD-dependent epimerase/dehydratase family protein [Acidobacteria bacterium]|nr:NAD-dependent epimerase/dehydratase family protein [Acidobacteriota bacterium]
MARSLFITGASGFVGRNLLRRIDPAKYKDIFVLIRSESKLAPSLLKQRNVRLVRGDLFECSLYAPYLASADCVIHLAAVTGKASPQQYFRVNVEGTRTLLEQCRRAGVQRFLHVSSIAVKFPNKARYYYAQSKEQAENVVRNSGLHHTIVRPSIIVGPGAPAWTNLAKLAGLPVIPVFGNGQASIQPIDIDDLLDFIISIVDKDIFNGDTLDLGGSQVISIEEFLRKIHWLRHHKDPRTVHIPLTLLIPVLTLLEKLFYSFLPITVGQLTSFRYDCTIEKNSLFEERLPRLKSIDAMLDSACSHDS